MNVQINQVPPNVNLIVNNNINISNNQQFAERMISQNNDRLSEIERKRTMSQDEEEKLMPNRGETILIPPVQNIANETNQRIINPHAIPGRKKVVKAKISMRSNESSGGDEKSNETQGKKEKGSHNRTKAQVFKKDTSESKSQLKENNNKNQDSRKELKELKKFKEEIDEKFKIEKLPKNNNLKEESNASNEVEFFNTSMPIKGIKKLIKQEQRRPTIPYSTRTSFIRKTGD